MRYIGLVFWWFCVTFSAYADARWELEKNDESSGIRVFTRYIEGSDLKEFRGEMRVKSTLTAPVALIEDVRRAPEWVDNCKVTELIEKLKPGEHIAYMINDVPWPVTDRDIIVHSLTTQDSTSKTVRIDMNARTDVFPENDEFIRITTLSGFWMFTPAADGYIDVIYQVHAEPNGGIPSWLANSIVVDAPYYTLKGMQRLLEEDKYQQAALPHVSNR